MKKGDLIEVQWLSSEALSKGSAVVVRTERFVLKNNPPKRKKMSDKTAKGIAEILHNYFKETQ